MSSSSEPDCSPPPTRSRHSTRSFTSLTPSDSRSNYRTTPRQNQQHLNQNQQQQPTQQQQQQQQPKQQQLTQQQHHQHQQQQQQQQKQKQQHHQPKTPSKLAQDHLPFLAGTKPHDLHIPSIEDPDDLFIKFTIREIRLIEQRARADADQKREDLRQMVGERYRDLLGAADSIVRMKLSAECLLQKLDHARSESDRTLLKTRAAAAGNSHKSLTSGSTKLSYVLATLVRLLLDLSEHVWRSLEREDFLTASRYVSLGRIISNELTSGNWDESGQTEPTEVIEMFPIVERQSDTLGQLGPQISSKAKLFLRKWDVKNQATLEALAAITLLDNTTLFDNLQLLLQVRKTVLRTLIASLNGSWTEHVENVVKLLVATLNNVKQIFLNCDFTNLLQAIQNGSSKEMHLKPLFSLLPNSHQLMRYIPKPIIEFSPFVTALAGSAGEFEPYPITQSWFEACQIDLISFIDQKLNQLQTAESLVEFRSQLHQAIGKLDGEFESTVTSFESNLMISLNKRFYELYQSRLNQLKNEIVQSLLLDPQISQTKHTQNEHENWILNKKLPILEPNDPSKFTKYLNSLQDRIEGKLIIEEENKRDFAKSSPNSSIVRKIEHVGKLLREDFEKWNRGFADDPTSMTVAPRNQDQAKVYVDLGNRFVEDCLTEIGQVLKQEIENSNLEGELNVGNLALQILSTRNSFMVDLCLVGRDHDCHQDGNELIRKFETGLNQILVDSASRWSQSILDQSVHLFVSSRCSLDSNNLQLNLERNESKLRTKPSDSILKSLDFISRSLVASLGVHRLKLQQANVLNTLIDHFLVGILDEQFVDLATHAAQSARQDPDDPLWESILFDLLFLIELIFNHPQIDRPPRRRKFFELQPHNGLKKLEELVEIMAPSDDKVNDKVNMIKENVVKFKATITRLWWPLILIEDPAEEKENADDGSSDLPKLATNDPSQFQYSALKLPKFGGLACVKPGPRFTLLAV